MADLLLHLDPDAGYQAAEAARPAPGAEDNEGRHVQVPFLGSVRWANFFSGADRRRAVLRFSIRVGGGGAAFISRLDQGHSAPAICDAADQRVLFASGIKLERQES